MKSQSRWHHLLYVSKFVEKELIIQLLYAFHGLVIERICVLALASSTLTGQCFTMFFY